jgi:hypothetical protein
MAENEMTYFKFVTDLIDSGIWAELSPGARALYPVLLRFSDRNFKPVFPGSQTLLKLTGFKQKSSLRKARKELTEHGLIWIEEGTGRKNSKYFFRFDWGVAKTTQGSAIQAPSAGPAEHPPGSNANSRRDSFSDSPYNQIHISINNNVPVQENSETHSLDSYIQRFGQKAVDLAISELKLGGMTVNDSNLKALLQPGIQKKEKSWSDIEKYLSEKISPGSLDILKKAFRKEDDGIFVFSDEIPAYLKNILQQLNTEIFFEPSVKSHRFWESQGVSI